MSKGLVKESSLWVYSERHRDYDIQYIQKGFHRSSDHFQGEFCGPGINVTLPLYHELRETLI